MEKICKGKKKTTLENELKEIEEQFQNKDSRVFYQEVKRTDKGSNCKPNKYF